ncbi:MAG: hypothetical protein ACYDH9_15955 [Limisphaerales bacterium]
MSFCAARYKAACRDYKANWEALDVALYDLCKKHPDHQSRGVINAKLWIIGRTYATGIERKIPSKGSQGSSMTQLADYLWMHRNKADTALRLLCGLREPLTPDKLKVILKAHGQLQQLVKGRLRKGQTPRSFVSKYLHFHCPAVPIYDNVAVASLRTAYPWKREFEVFKLHNATDEEYGCFVLRFWRLYHEAKSSAAEVSVKLLDHYLLASAMDGR